MGLFYSHLSPGSLLVACARRTYDHVLHVNNHTFLKKGDVVMVLDLDEMLLKPAHPEGTATPWFWLEVLTPSTEIVKFGGTIQNINKAFHMSGNSRSETKK